MKLPGFFGKGDKKEAPPAAPVAAPVPAAPSPAAAAPGTPGQPGVRRPTGSVRPARLRPGQVPPAPPPPPEKIYSKRHLSWAGQVILLVLSCWIGADSWYNLVGEWPTLGNLAPPRVKSVETVSAFEFTRQDRMFIAGPEELTWLRPEHKILPFRDETTSLPSPIVTSIRAVSGITWIGTTRGLVSHDGNRFSRMDRKSPLYSAHITSLASDSSGILWVGTASEGLVSRSAKGVWRQYRDELPSPYVTALAASSPGRVWVSFFAGEVLRTDGNTWERVRTPENSKGKAVRSMAALPDGSVIILAQEGLNRVTAVGWEPLDPAGLPAKEKPFFVVSSPSSVPYLVTRDGSAYRLDSGGSAAVRIMTGSTVTALQWKGNDLYLAANGAIWRVVPNGKPVPLTTWGRFMYPERYFPPVAELPSDWTDFRFRQYSGGLALMAFLLAGALFLRSLNWQYTNATLHKWRLIPLRTAAAGVAGFGIIFWLQRLGWMSTRAWMILWKPIMVVVALWLFMHWMRVISHEWKEKQDAFWMGAGIVISTVGAWLWWVAGTTLPALIICVVGALFFGTSLRGLGARRWKGLKFAWGTAVFLFEVAAIFPPLLFMFFEWGGAGFRMAPTTTLAGNLSSPPDRFTWSDDGLNAAYVMPGMGVSRVNVLDGHTKEWKVREVTIPWGDVSPSFSPNSTGLALAYRKGADTIVSFSDMAGRSLWQSRVPGTAVPGQQPCWTREGDSLVMVTVSGAGSSVWRLNRKKGDAVKVSSSVRRLSWPALSRDGKQLYCAASGREPGLAVVDMSSGEISWMAPTREFTELPIVFDPGMEGKAVLEFLDKVKLQVKRQLASLHFSLQRIVRIFGWRTRLPDFWPSKPLFRIPVRGPAAFNWAEYYSIRQLTVALNGKSIAFIAKVRDGGEELYHMDIDGKQARVIFHTDGRISDFKWTWYKNRMVIVEEHQSMFAPLVTRRILLVQDPPEETVVKPLMPLTRWVSSPAFTPDGRDVVFAAPDNFWKIHVWPADRYGFFEVNLESTIGVFGAPTETLTEKRAEGGGHGAKPKGGGGHH